MERFTSIHPDALELAELLHPTWPAFDAQLVGQLVAKDDDDEGGKDDEGKDDEVKMSKAEADRLKRSAAENDRAKKDAEKRVGELESTVDDLKQQVEDAQDDDEKKKLERRAERAEEKAQKAEDRVTELEGKITSSEQEATIREVAKRLKFKNPDLAAKFVSDDDRGSESAIESALKETANREPYLVGGGDTQREVTPPSGGGNGDDPAKDRGGQGDEKRGVERVKSAYGSSESTSDKE